MQSSQRVGLMKVFFTFHKSGKCFMSAVLSSYPSKNVKGKKEGLGFFELYTGLWFILVLSVICRLMFSRLVE